MGKAISLLLITVMAGLCSTAQQLVRVKGVRLVTTSAPADTLQLISRGGISFIGNSVFDQHGKLVLLSNPVSGNSDWLDSTGGVISSSSTGTVHFRGTQNLQTIGGATVFHGLGIEGVGVNLNQSNEVRNRLSLTEGLVYFASGSDSIYVTNPASSSVDYNSDPFVTTSWVHGKLSRRMNLTGADYEFPVGKIKDGDSLYAPVKLEKQNNAGATFTVQYLPEEPADRASKNALFHHVSQLEYWQISSHDFSQPDDNIAKLSLSWRTYSAVSPAAIHWDSLLIAHYIDMGAGNFMWEPEYSTLPAQWDPGSSIDFGYFTNEKFIGDFSMPHSFFTIGTRTFANPLPVTLLDYRIELVNNQSVMNRWIVTNDTRVATYQVERSVDNIRFTGLGSVVSARSTGASDYSFSDQQPARGWNYYRLKIVGDNGFHYSPTRKVFLGATDVFTLYPNPATDFVYIRLPGIGSAALLTLVDNNGRIISSVKPLATTVQLNVGKLPGGVYHVRYQSGPTVYARSFIKN